MWILYALLSALSAAGVALLGKAGLKNIDSTLATTIRAAVMALFLLTVSLFLRKFNGRSLHELGSTEWLYIIGAGIAGALSWLFYFYALKLGPASGVAALDRTSVVFVIIFAALFLGESLSLQSVAGACLIAAGAILLVLK